MKVAIIGHGAAIGAAGIYQGTGWKIWGINSVHRNALVRGPQDWDAMFNLHRLAHLERDCPQYVDWDSTFSRRNPKVPMVVVDTWGGLLEREVIYPRKAIAKMPRGEYHASSFDMAVAYAIHLKAKVIHLHGANFATDSPREEPISARACLEYWCGYAQGRGIELRAFSCHGLFRQFHLVMSDSYYGFDDVQMIEERGRRAPAHPLDLRR
jgi:hypothetical protein